MPSPKSRSTAVALPVTPDLAVAQRASAGWPVLALDELRDCGLTKNAVAVRVRRGHLHRLFRAVYAVGHTKLPLEAWMLAAVKACGPGTVVSHRSAAILHGLLPPARHRLEVTAPSRHRIKGIVVHQSERIERTYVKGIPVSPILRTIIDLGRTSDEATVKRALRQARLPAHLLARLPRRITGLGAVDTWSPLEDEARDFVVAGGLREPAEVNRPYRLATRTVYPDLRWPELRLIVAVDSVEWHDDPLARRDDALRQAELEALGERVIRITKADMRDRPQQTLARLRAAGVPSH